MIASSCWTQGRKAIAPPPPQPTVQLPIDATPPQRIDTPPAIVAPEPPKMPQPDLPEPARTRQEALPARVRKISPAAPPQVTVDPPQVVGPQQPAPAPPPVEIPELGPMLTPEEQRAYESAINEMSAQARQNIVSARSRQMNSKQKDLVERAEGFLEQANRLRQQDPAAAKSLAGRAELLSREAVRP